MRHNKFWNLPKCSKLDVLVENEYNHTEVILAAMGDSETLIERIDRETYTLYGLDESLLVRPVTPVLRIGLHIYLSVLMFIHKN